MEEETSSGGTAAGGGTTTEPGGGEVTSEEEAQAALAEADPVGVARATAVASYAAVKTASLVEAQVLDPQAVDPVVLEQLVNQAAPIASDEALAWVDTLDAETLAQSIRPDFSCPEEPYLCEWNARCDWLLPKGTFCVVSGCGLGSCPICPVLFSNLIVDSWCSYGCLHNGQVIGGAFTLKTRFRDLGPICIPL